MHTLWPSYACRCGFVQIFALELHSRSHCTMYTVYTYKCQEFVSSIWMLKLTVKNHFCCVMRFTNTKDDANKEKCTELIRTKWEDEKNKFLRKWKTKGEIKPWWSRNWFVRFFLRILPCYTCMGVGRFERAISFSVSAQFSTIEIIGKFWFYRWTCLP